MGRKEEYEYLVRRSREFYETAVLQLKRKFEVLWVSRF